MIKYGKDTLIFQDPSIYERFWQNVRLLKYPVESLILMSILAFLAFAGIIWGFLNGRLEAKAGFDILIMGAVLVLVAGTITYMIYIILNFGA